ncbi:MAG: DNA polymerase Y family protein [Betaproteobacteria bacterium]|nr:MAG: DNA polymerase Y family protein [Betaproteobacteria bacterium]
MPMLWIALHLPRLPLEAFQRGLPSPEPCAVAERQHLLVCDAKAAARGLRAGMPVTAALALAPGLRLRERDAAAETEALLGIAAWAMQCTPNVALAFPDLVLLEVSGSLKLFGGLVKIEVRLRQGLAAMGYGARLAAAPTPRAASWFARAGGQRLIADAALLERELSALPLSVLESKDEETLSSIGIRSIGELLALPRDGLARRFGQRLLDTLDQALGRLPDPRGFCVLPEKFYAAIELPAEATQAEALLFAAKRLLAQLEGFLAARAAGTRQVLFSLTHRAAPATRIELGMVTACREATHFALLLRERLPQTALPVPVRAIGLEVQAIEPLAHSNQNLFADALREEGNWPRLIERLRARLGAAAVHGMGLRADHRPERASVPAEPGAKQLALDFEPRPFWLLERPQGLEENASVPCRDGPLKLLAGPERIESGWWDGADVARDYFIARAANEALLWVYRERSPAGAWYLHGIFS